MNTKNGRRLSYMDRAMNKIMAQYAGQDDPLSTDASYEQLIGTPAKPGGFRDRFALSAQGYKSLLEGTCWCVAGNLGLMLPVGIIYLATTQFVDHLINPAAPLPNIWLYLGMIIVALALMLATQWMQYGKTYNPVYTESARSRISLAEKLRMLPLSFFGRRDVSDLTTAVLTDCAQIEQVFSHVMPELIGTLISTAIAAIALFIYNWQLALAVIWVVPVCFAVLYATRSIQTRYGEDFNNRRLDVAFGMQEFLECMNQLRASGQSQRYLKQVGASIDRAEQAQIKAELIPGTIVSSVAMFLNIGKATTILVGAGLVLSGQIGFMTYFLFLLAASILYLPVGGTFESTAELLSINTHTARLREIHNEPSQQGSDSFNPNGHDIVFDDVRFSYEKDMGTNANRKASSAAADMVLDGVSFTAREGEVTALVGPSGSGKSTISKLAARFWDPTGGTITVGGVDVAGISPEPLLRDYSMVFQDVLLFNDTIMENIRIGRHDATDEDVRSAAQAANCDEFVNRLADGYATVIGENGDTLSGGERQRISIARALLKDAPIVLLDEATASLDAENETEVQGALSSLLTGKTVLVIAHRMRTVANADKIIVLSDGHITETGTPADLMARKGIFAHMVALQGESSSWSLKH